MSSHSLAILVADLHLSHKPPVARSDEPDWYAAQARPLDQLKALAEKLDVPVLCAGDVFDRWNSPPELVNFAIDHLPRMYAVPGQHDLPLHRYEDVQKSSYGTLVKAGVLTDLTPGKDFKLPGFSAQGFPWGTPPGPPAFARAGPRVAVVHHYVWSKGHVHPGAGEEDNYKSMAALFAGFNTAVYGDNHSPFQRVGKQPRDLGRDPGTPDTWNCGGLQRRRADENNHAPRLGVLLADGSVLPYVLDCSQDVLKPMDMPTLFQESGLDYEDFLQTLSEMGESALDFCSSVERYCSDNKVRKSIKGIIDQLIEQAKAQGEK